MGEGGERWSSRPPAGGRVRCQDHWSPLVFSIVLSSCRGEGQHLWANGWERSLGLLLRWGLATWCSCPPMSLSVPPGCGRGGGGTVFPELRSNRSCWQGTAGPVGRGRLAAPLSPCC